MPSGLPGSEARTYNIDSMRWLVLTGINQRGGTSMKKATFGAGCFWGIESAFRQVPGVTDAAVGYLGGTLENPTYQDVCSGSTGHAEVVEVDYDPSKVSERDCIKKEVWNIPTKEKRERITGRR